MCGKGGLLENVSFSRGFVIKGSQVGSGGEGILRSEGT